MLFTFEGIDGSGKSTQARLLVEHLRAAGYDPLPVREPGGTALSERVRALLLDPALTVAPMAELLLFAAARAQLVEERLRPALRAGRVVVCDRFYDSTTAYQGAGRRLLDPTWLAGFHRRVTGGLVPARTYLLELAPAAARVRLERPEGDRMEAADEAFHARVAAAYARLAEAHPERILRLDATRPAAEIHQRIAADAEAVLQRLSGTALPNGGSPTSDDEQGGTRHE